MSEQEFLEPWQMAVVNYVEHIYGMTGGFPSDDDTMKYLSLMQYNEPTKNDLENLKANNLFNASMESRGILTSTFLNARQLAAVATMLNLTDRRSDEKKLRDIGVSTEEFSAWMLNRNFAEYIRQRSEMLIENSTHEAHVGLMRGVKQGNTASIKLYYEMTGRYNPNAENEVNVRMVIGKVLEAIQRRVREPKVLNELAIELSQIAIEAGSPVAKSVNIIPSTRNELK